MVCVNFGNNGKRKDSSNDADVKERSAKRKQVSYLYRMILTTSSLYLCLKIFDKREMLIFNIRIKPSLKSVDA